MAISPPPARSPVPQRGTRLRTVPTQGQTCGGSIFSSHLTMTKVWNKTVKRMTIHSWPPVKC